MAGKTARKYRQIDRVKLRQMIKAKQLYTIHFAELLLPEFLQVATKHFSEVNSGVSHWFLSVHLSGLMQVRNVHLLQKLECNVECSQE